MAAGATALTTAGGAASLQQSLHWAQFGPGPGPAPARSGLLDREAGRAGGACVTRDACGGVRIRDACVNSSENLRAERDMVCVRARARGRARMWHLILALPFSHTHTRIM